MNQKYFAHSKNKVGEWHSLADHLKKVTELIESYAKDSKLKTEAQAVGLLHDIGKYGEKFQERLKGIVSGVDHWSTGAWIALSEIYAIAAALSIQGHHIGLQYLNKDSLKNIHPKRLIGSHPLQLTLSEPDTEILKSRLREDGVIFNSIDNQVLGKDLTSNISRMLDVRMLFSCLVDADFIDTEAHFQATSEGKCFRRPGPPLRPLEALAILERKICSLQEDKSEGISREVLAVRQSLYEACLAAAAENDQKLFTLTAPTGSGKTLSMLAFALKNAVLRERRRIVFVIPYLSIIEQTATIYREIFLEHFGSEYILEHHSLAGIRRETSDNDNEDAKSPGYRVRLLSENWDAPMIITGMYRPPEPLGGPTPWHRLRAGPRQGTP